MILCEHMSTVDDSNDLHMCFQAWLNEKFSPDLLENKSEIVECVMEQLTHMVNNTLFFSSI